MLVMNKTRIKLSVLLVVLLISISAFPQEHTAIAGNSNGQSKIYVDKRKPGDPLKNLPGNVEVLTEFGERADISPDNNSVAFMSKTFGDAMVIDLKTRKIE